jgi:hypothetical protein
MRETNTLESLPIKYKWDDNEGVHNYKILTQSQDTVSILDKLHNDSLAGTVEINEAISKLTKVMLDGASYCLQIKKTKTKFRINSSATSWSKSSELLVAREYFFLRKTGIKK